MGNKKKHKSGSKKKAKEATPPAFASESFLIECKGKDPLLYLRPTLEDAKRYVEEYVGNDTYCKGSIRCFNVHGVEYAVHHFGSRSKVEFCWSDEE